jgi:hypothetical protein
MTESREPTADEIKLRDIKAKRDALEAARELRHMPTVQEQIATEERKLATAQKLDELETAHGYKPGVDMDVVESRVGDVIIKRPTMAVYRRFQDSGTNETKDLDNLVRPCVLHPSRAEFDQMVEALPLLLAHCADLAVMLAGYRAKKNQGK